MAQEISYNEALKHREELAKDIQLNKIAKINHEKVIAEIKNYEKTFNNLNNESSSYLTPSILKKNTGQIQQGKKPNNIGKGR